jgi:HlyD family type I secretion membrane fusion protein
MTAWLRDLLVPGEDLDAGIDVMRIVRIGVAIIATGLIGLGGWAVFAPLSGAVIAPGFVKVDLNRKVVQHQEGGIVREIHVRDGDHVRQGQELILLDDVRVDAQLDLLRVQLDSELARGARLTAEAASRRSVVYPRELMAHAKDPKTAEIFERENALFRSRREALESQIAELRRQIVETGNEAKALSEQIAAEERALGLQKQELAANQELLRQNYVQKTRVLTLERAVAEYEARYGEHRAELAKTHQKTSELQLRILSMENQYRQNATDELKDNTAKIFDLQERLRPTQDASERQRITAPIAGEVVGLKVFTPGAVIGPRDVLMEIVPDDKRLIVEARIRPEDINHVQVGSEADIRLTAYKQRNTPLVQGDVSYVSGDRLTDPQNGAGYYVVHIDVPPEALAAAGNLHMTAGMPAEVFIRTDTRTAFDYLFAPVTAYFRRGMREPL